MTEAPRKPQWFPPPRALPHPRNLPAAPLIKPEAPKPAVMPERGPNEPRPGGIVWRLPWPLSALEMYAPSSHKITAAGRRYLASVEEHTAARRREFRGPLWVSVTLVPPAGVGRHVQSIQMYALPVLDALAYIGAWHDTSQVRAQRFVLDEPADDACAWAVVAPL